jgi:hypothetical protein
VVLPFSIARRQSSGQTFSFIVRHAVVRSLILVVLGMIMIAVHPRRWIWWFDDTLTQIGLAHTLLLLLGYRPARDRWIALGVILAWLLDVVHAFPAAGPGF